MNIVMKFGGTSVADGRTIHGSARLVKNHHSGNKVIVVVSAMDNVTDQLIIVAEKAKNRLLDEVEARIKEMRMRHINAVEDAITMLENKAQILDFIEESFRDLGRILAGVGILGELTPRIRDKILSFGERLTAAIFSKVLLELNVKGVYFTGGEAGIMTDDAFGEANPILDASRSRIQSRLGPLLERGEVPVVSGFIAENQDGEVTTLGRGGSDYSATVLAFALNADEVWLWSDVDGIMTSDPKTIKEARVISSLSYNEALEMAVFGAKAMHPRALEPAAEQHINVRVKNTFNPDAPGTLITQETRVKSGDIVKAVALVQDAGVISISGGGMFGRPGTSAKIFDVFGSNGINILMISQSVSESNITLLVRNNVLQKAVGALEKSLLGKGQVSKVSFDDDVSIVAVVGAGMRGTAGVAARVFKAVAEKGINIGMIAQGSSELNISFVVKKKDGLEAVRALHKEFRLSETQI